MVDHTVVELATRVRPDRGNTWVNWRLFLKLEITAFGGRPPISP